MSSPVWQRVAATMAAAAAAETGGGWWRERRGGSSCATRLASATGWGVTSRLRSQHASRRYAPSAPPRFPHPPHPLRPPALPTSPAPSAPSRTLYTFPHPLHPPAPSDTPPLPCPLSQGERSSALLLLVAAAASAGVYQLVCAARHALAAGRSRRERMRSAVACLVRALLLLAASVPVQRCEGDGGYGGGCADKDFEYDGFEVIHKAVASST